MKRIAIVATMLAAEPALADRRCGTTADGGSSERDHRESSTYSREETRGPWADTVSAPSSAPAGCTDDTDVVGFRKCTKFGGWAANMRLPRLFVELGTNVRQFATGLQAQTGHLSHGSEQFAFRAVMTPTQAAADDTAVTTSLRIGAGLGRGLYAGTELELGGLVSPAAANAEMMTSGSFGAPSIEQERGLVLGALGVAGFRTNGRRGSLSVEGAAGVRSARYHFASAYYDCDTTSAIVVTRGVVEARARGELFLNPWLTAGATVGSNVTAKGDWMAGVFLGFHTRAFAGGR